MDFDDLPPGWAWATLGEVTELPDSVSPAAIFADCATFTYVDLSAIKNGRIITPQRLAPADAPSRARQRICTGDTLFSCVRVYLENIAFVSPNLDGQIASTAFAVLRPRAGIDPGYLHWLVRQPDFIKRMNEAQRGNSPPSVQEGDVRDAMVPIAPPAEQSRIATEVEKLFEQLDETEAALARAREGVGQFRASLLHAACTGALTADWRAANPSAETGEALLRRILTERRAAWERTECARLEATGTPLRVDAWKARYVEPTPPAEAELQELPVGWAWATLDHLIREAPRNGISVQGTPDPPGVAALKLDALGEDGLRFDRRRYLDIPMRKALALYISKGDFFVSRANGSPAFLARACVAGEPPEPVIFPDTMIRFRFHPLALAEWVALAWRSDLTRRQILQKAKTSAGILKVSQDDLLSVHLPIPPLVEQGVILATANVILAEAGNMTVVSADTNLSSLRQSILHAAFSGHLVPQDPADEPAAVLLARLRATPAPARRTRRRTQTEAFA